MAKSSFSLACTLLVVAGCGGTHGTTSPPDLAPSAADAGIEGQHGQLLDYFNLTPLVGFTVTDGDNTTTSDAQGNWVLPLAVGHESTPVVTGPDYSRLQLAKVKATGSDVDIGKIPMPSSSTYGLELSIVAADQTKSLVQVVIVPTGACKSLAGGTLTVVSPPGASVAYFSPAGLPTAAMFYDVVSNRPVAAVYNIDPDAKSLEVTMSHPTCKLAASGTALGGAQFDGIGALAPAEPGDFNATMVLLAE